MFKLFQNVFRLLGKLSVTPVTLFTPTVVLLEDLGPIQMTDLLIAINP